MSFSDRCRQAKGVFRGTCKSRRRTNADAMGVAPDRARSAVRLSGRGRRQTGLPDLQGARARPRRHLTQGEDPPGINLAILDLAGGTGAGGNFRPGDKLKVNFTLKKDDGSDWDIAELVARAAPRLGPDLQLPARDRRADRPAHGRRSQQTDGSYTYTFADADPRDLPGAVSTTRRRSGPRTASSPASRCSTAPTRSAWTLQLGLHGRRRVRARRGQRDVDFLLGDAAALEPREVVKIENCNRCHDRAARPRRPARRTSRCASSATRRAPRTRTTGGATPGVSIDFQVMIHKIHNGSAPASVLGVATNPDGSRNYAATPAPYIVGPATRLLDASRSRSARTLVAHAAGPWATRRSRRGQKANEDEIRTGVVDCDVCHGDPDGDRAADRAGAGRPPTDAAHAAGLRLVPRRHRLGPALHGQRQTMPRAGQRRHCTLCHAAHGQRRWR